MPMITREQHYSQTVSDPHWFAAIFIAVMLVCGAASTFYVKAHPEKFTVQAAAAVETAKNPSCSEEFAAFRRAAYDVQLNLLDVSLALPYESCALGGRCEGEQGMKFALGDGRESACLGCP